SSLHNQFHGSNHATPLLLRLAPFLARDQFKKWIHSTIQKAFRSYTNPTAAKMLFEAFGADRLSSSYSGIEGINQYLFKKVRDPGVIAVNRVELGFDPEKHLVPFAEAFPDGLFYHGTADERSFRSIAFQGALPSREGLAGAGLYGVSSRDMGPALQYSGGKDDLVVMMRLDPRTTLLNMTQPASKELYEKFRKSRFVGPGDSLTDGITRFAEILGVDVIEYDFERTTALVVKNPDVIRETQGWKRKVLTLDQLRRHIDSHQLNFVELMKLIKDNGLTRTEFAPLFELTNAKKAIAEVARMDTLQIFQDPSLTEFSWYLRFSPPQLLSMLDTLVATMSVEEYLKYQSQSFGNGDVKWHAIHAGGRPPNERFILDLLKHPGGLFAVLRMIEGDGILGAPDRWTIADRALVRAVNDGLLPQIENRWEFGRFSEWVERVTSIHPASFDGDGLFRMANLGHADHRNAHTWDSATRLLVGLTRAANLATSDPGIEAARLLLTHSQVQSWEMWGDLSQRGKFEDGIKYELAKLPWAGAKGLIVAAAAQMGSSYGRKYFLAQEFAKLEAAEVVAKSAKALSAPKSCKALFLAL
ncbi:MAG: hypothetical protein AAB250_11285, partial [Bdellovibrionota bacterium]